MDAIGVRIGFCLAVILWSLAAIAHALVRTVASFSLVLALLGLAEGGNFPGAVKGVSEWFPRKERALATGIFNAGSNVGALLTPLIVPVITVSCGWPMAFLVRGSLGFLWLLAWIFVYHSPDQHPRVSPDELAYIRSDPPDPVHRIGWVELLRYRPTWAFAVGMFCTVRSGGSISTWCRTSFTNGTVWTCCSWGRRW